MRELLAVGIGGFAGAVLRHLLSLGVRRVFDTSWPLGTLCVNLLGCVGIGLLYSLLAERSHWPAEVRLVVGVGLLGSMTTFSTFGLETVELARAGESGAALSYVALSLGLGLIGVVAGAALGRALA